MRAGGEIEEQYWVRLLEKCDNDEDHQTYCSDIVGIIGDNVTASQTCTEVMKSFGKLSLHSLGYDKPV